jgi:glycyl-tRNA synthetase
MKWHIGLGFPAEHYRFHDHVKLAHYADAAVDIEYAFPIGWKEVEGIHSRTDFDLSNHQQYSGKKMQYFDHEINQNYIPYVIETSIGLDRMFLLTLSHAYTEEKWVKEDGKEDSRVVLRIPPKLAPIKLAVLPLVKKDGLPEIALDLMHQCRKDFYCFYEEKDTIGKRYRRMDAIGTPYCVTIDHQTKEDQTVTIRHRDDMRQERIPLAAVRELVRSNVL